jgi:hypothetical protein
MDMRQGVALIALAGVLSGALGWAAGAAVSADPVPAPEALDQPAATTAPADPLRVTLAGDSVMAGLAPAVEAALEGGGGAEVEFVLTPSILRDATVRFSWAEQLETFDPDVVVMFVGTWELGEVTNAIGTAVGPQDPAWRETYERDVLDPWVELVTSAGAEILWLGAPAVPAPEVNALFDSLNTSYRALPDRFPAVTYLDSTAALAGPEAGFQPTVTAADGTELRVRQVDGLHLCPDGAVLLAGALLAELEDERDLSVAPGWEHGSWRDHEEYPIENCPPL